MFYPLCVDQISFFSAEARGPRAGDLAGVLCGHGQVVSFGRTAARLSVELAEGLRARALAMECGRRGVTAEVTSSAEGQPLVRTPFRVDLLPLADDWCPGAGKEVPRRFLLDGPTLRMWVLACGIPTERGYLLPLDPDAPDTHDPLTAALGTIGLPAQRVGPKAGGPALRVTGKRRLATLEELVGRPPAGAEPLWPSPRPLRQAS